MHDFRYSGKKLFCEGVAIEALAKKFGTPLYVYSQHTLADHFQKLDRALAPLDHWICFAMKANSNLSVLRTLANLGSAFDVVSAGELQRVIAAGGDPRKCVFAGVAKTGAEIEFALRQNVYSFNAESEPELHRINQIAARLKKVAPVSVRVNPNIAAKTHANRPVFGSMRASISLGEAIICFSCRRSSSVNVILLFFTTGSLPKRSKEGVDERHRFARWRPSPWRSVEASRETQDVAMERRLDRGCRRAVVGLLIWRQRRSPYPVTEIFQGVHYGCDRVEPTDEGTGLIHWVSVDLTVPGIELYVTPTDPSAVNAGWQYRLRTTGSVVAEEHLAVAVNGTLFSSNSGWIQMSGDLARSVEIVVSDHEVSHLWEHTYLLWFDDGLTPHLKPSMPPIAAELAEAKWDIGGQGVGLRGGKVEAGENKTPNSRTAVGVDCDRKLLFLAVGEWISPRLILQKLQHLGAKDGMLLDGGGSSCMAIGAGARGIRPGVLHGGWRPVATCFGVRARTF